MTERYHHGDLREALLQAATEMLVETGPKGLSLREAARRAGVSTGAPYRHFKDKDALLVALAARGFDALHEALQEVQAACAESDALERVQRLGVAYVEFAADQPALFRLMFGELAPKTEGQPELLAASKAAGAHLPAAILAVQQERALGDLDVEDATLMAWAVVHGVAALHLDGHLNRLTKGTKRESATEVAERVTGALVKLLGA